MDRRYTIITRSRLLRDEASVRRHIEADDYFGTVATILSLIKEQIKKDPNKKTPDLISTLIEIEKDLTLLQSRCQIIFREKNYTKPNTKNKKITPKGRLISQ